MFERPHHQAIQKILDCLNAQLLLDAQCYFGGGTAAVLLLGEYRESVDNEGGYWADADYPDGVEIALNR